MAKKEFFFMFFLIADKPLFPQGIHYSIISGSSIA